MTNIIQEISNLSGTWLASKVHNTEYPTVEDQISVYRYGFQFIYGSIFKGFTLLLTAYLLGIIIPVLIIVTTYASFRIFGGGYHMQTYLRCLLISLFQFISSALVVKYTYLNWTQINIFVIFTFTILSALYVIIKYVPRDTPNKPITKQEDIKRFKQLTLYYLIAWSILIGSFIYFDMGLIVLPSCFGLLLELFSITRLGVVVHYLLDCKHCPIKF